MLCRVCGAAGAHSCCRSSVRGCARLCVDVFRSRAQGQQVPGAGARALVWCRARTVALSRACRHYAPGTNRCFVSRVRGTKYCVVPNRSAPCVRAPVLASGHALLFFCVQARTVLRGATRCCPGAQNKQSPSKRASGRCASTRSTRCRGRAQVFCSFTRAGSRHQVPGARTGVLFFHARRQQDRTRACFVFLFSVQAAGPNTGVFCVFVFLSRVHAPGGEY